MKAARLESTAIALVIGLVTSAVVGTGTAWAEPNGTLEIPLPISVQESFYVEVLQHSVYTPKLTEGKVAVAYSIVGQQGDLVAESTFECPADRPDPIIRLMLTDTQGNLSASAKITGTTRDPQTGQDGQFEATVPDPPASVGLVTSDTQLLRVCGGGDPDDGDPDGSARANQVPVASYQADCSELSCIFTDSSTDPDGTVTGWKWDLGDGTVSTQQHPAHTYPTGGTYQVTLSVTDDRGATTSTTTPVTVTAPLVIETTGLADAKKKESYAQSLRASGGSASYSWSVSSGALPKGLSLTSGGDLTGTARNPGTYSFTVQVRDADAASTNRAFTLRVAS